MMKMNPGIFHCLIYGLVTLLTLPAITSCSNEQATDDRNDRSASLKIVLSGQGTMTRASGSALPGNESTVNTIAVGLFFEGGAVNIIVEPDITPNSSGGLVSGNILCSPGTCDVIVVANVPKGVFAGVNSKNEFISKAVSLSQTTSNGKQTSNQLPMSGISSSAVVLEAGKSVTASVSLSRLVSRISISSIRTEFSGNNINATFKLDRVFLCNALESSKVAPGDINVTRPVTSTWIHGGTVNENSTEPDGSFTWIDGSSFLLDKLTTPIAITGTEYTTPYWFYAFANDDQTHRTKLVLSGYFDQDGDGTAHQPVYAYYPIVVNKTQQGTVITGPADNPDAPELGNGTIARNRDYRIKAVLKGSGSPTPGSEIQPSNLELTVNVEDWALVVMQEVEVN